MRALGRIVVGVRAMTGRNKEGMTGPNLVV
jgi:hypothetical protein